MFRPLKASEKKPVLPKKPPVKTVVKPTSKTVAKPPPKIEKPIETVKIESLKVEIPPSNSQKTSLQKISNLYDIPDPIYSSDEDEDFEKELERMRETNRIIDEREERAKRHDEESKRLLEEERDKLLKTTEACEKLLRLSIQQSDKKKEDVIPSKREENTLTNDTSKMTNEEKELHTKYLKQFKVFCHLPIVREKVSNCIEALIEYSNTRSSTSEQRYKLAEHIFCQDVFDIRKY